MPFNENDDINDELEKYYNTSMKQYMDSLQYCMDSYCHVASTELGQLDNAYGNLDFMISNKSIRQSAYDDIFDKMRNIIVYQFRSEAYHFNLLQNNKGNFAVCALKVSELNQKYFISEEENIHGYVNTLIYQNVFDEVDKSLEKFRCKIYRIKYVEPKREPTSGKMLYFGEDEK